MYECVLGIPKSEGMQAPPKIPANPSFVELDEDENAVETFKTAMGNIASILALDKLKQVWNPFFEKNSCVVSILEDCAPTS